MMFGKSKAARIRELEAEVASQHEYIKKLMRESGTFNTQLRASQNQVEYLVRTIRDIDQELFNMSQRTDWLGMRPYFQKLCDGMTARKVAESDRIGDIMRQQLIETYTPRDVVDAPKKITRS
jgi:uncharacterized coiled-coil protein SlyX